MNNSKNCKPIIDNFTDNQNLPINSCLFSLPPKQFALLSSLLGILFIDDLNLDQQNALGNFIVNIGQAILTSAAQEQSLQSNNSQNDDILQELETLKKQISSLNMEIEKLK